MPDAINVRPLRRADLADLKQVLRSTELFPPDLLYDMAEPFLSGHAPHSWLVADGDGVVGFAYAEPERITDGTHNLLAIAVRTDFQSLGIGRALVSTLIQSLKKRGARILLVETSSLDQYARTRAFYSGQGFTPEARIRDFYTDGEDKIVFWKRL